MVLEMALDGGEGAGGRRFSYRKKWTEDSEDNLLIKQRWGSLMGWSFVQGSIE